ncbi:MAG: GGDEF domain-containing protein [Actinomycetota bacterium]
MASAALLHNRKLALLLAAGGYGAVFAAFLVFESGKLGIAHFFYLPVILVALVSDALGGILAGFLGAGLYCAAVVLDPRIPSRDALTTQTGIRAITFALVGAVVGVYASRNRQLVARLERHASTDFVTGVGNVRAFDEELRRRFDAQMLFTLLLVDIDELRRVNEVHGHTAGDEALRRVAGVLGGAADAGDAIARVGGDEFAVLTMLRPDAVPELGAQVNALLAPDLQVTLAGVASTDAETADGLVKKADDRLFAAKMVRPNRRRLSAV